MFAIGCKYREMKTAKRNARGLTCEIDPLVEHYRCLENVEDLVLTGKLSPEPGYFRFGQDVVCYGQVTVGSPATKVTHVLPDLSGQVTLDGTLGLPFNAVQVVDNLRYERYTMSGNGGGSPFLHEAIRKTYYCLRPLLGVSIRKHLQRLFFRNWEHLPFPAWPVDRTVEHILERLLLLSMQSRQLEKVPFIWFWPHGARSCVIVTHDVETKAGAEFIPYMMDLDEGSAVRASFQVIPERQYPVSKALLNGIRDRGFDLNVHDLRHDDNLFSDREQFVAQARSINAYVRDWGSRGFRAGRMYRNVDWYGALDISYDMSVPNVAHLEPQRGGCCTVFPYFIGDILELPLTTTDDYSLFHILGDFSIELWKKQSALVMEKHGMASFLVHPDYIIEKRARDIYGALLKYLAALRNEQNVWIASPGEVDRWWRERSQMRLVPHDKGWRVEGPGQEKARIAHARMVEGQIVYTWDENP